ncbi:DUF2683 family protein [Flavobacterium sp. SM2513]|uniref:DUF2683 family protein n=1 Tax=Flavobacterium sp. SM2513 TaxID=3424766 RepID=UPI003D7F5D2C
METITIKVNENSRKGKAFIEFLKAFFSEEGDVQLIAIDGVLVTNSSESDFKSVAENGAKYKTIRKAKKEIKVKSSVETEISPYNPEFVKMVLDAAKSKNRTTIDPNDIWGSLGLK